MSDHHRLSQEIAVMKNDLDYIKKHLGEINTKLDKKYVTKEEFEQVRSDYVKRSEFHPVRKIVYGIIGIILAAVAIAIIGMVIP